LQDTGGLEQAAATDALQKAIVVVLFELATKSSIERE
jgi:hypothetical protein